MKHLKILILCLFLAIGVSAQTVSASTITVLQQEIQLLKSANKRLNNDLSSQKKQLQAFSESISAELETNCANIRTLSDSLGIKIAETEKSAQTQISSITESVDKKSLFAVIGGTALLFLSVALFIWLYRKQKTNRADFIGKLEKQKLSVEEQLVKEFSRQTEILQSLSVQNSPFSTPNSSLEIDHSLALKLADEITLMERNISFMDSNTKGLKQLNRSIGKLKDNLAANGYEIPELLGKPYNEGMKAIITNTIQDENLEKGVELITKIIKPQVNYQDKMIQAAQIEVSVGFNN